MELGVKMAHKRNNVSREFRHGMRGESAIRCIGDLYTGCEIMGLTKGDFSMIDILTHCLDQTGIADVVIGTWTAGHADVKQAERIFTNGGISNLRMLVDRSFPNRQPKYFQRLIETFGPESVRLARFHAKFILIKSETYNLVVRTSMNLNENKRIELYEISDDAEMMGYYDEIVEAHFSQPMEDSYSAFKSLKIGPELAASDSWAL